MDYDRLAALWLTRSGRSLWDHIEGTIHRTPQEYGRMTLDPRAIRDPRAEVLLLGLCGHDPEAGRRGYQRAGLQPNHVTTAKICGMLFGKEIRDSAAMGEYLYASAQVTALWSSHLAGFPEDCIPLEAARYSRELCEVSTEDVAYALAARVVRLAEVRRKLRDAYATLAGQTEEPRVRIPL